MATEEFDYAQYDYKLVRENREGFAKCYRIERPDGLIGYLVRHKHSATRWTVLDVDGGFVFPDHAPRRAASGIAGVTYTFVGGWTTGKAAAMTYCGKTPVKKTDGA